LSLSMALALALTAGGCGVIQKSTASDRAKGFTRGLLRTGGSACTELLLSLLPLHGHYLLLSRPLLLLSSLISCGRITATAIGHFEIGLMV